MEFPGPGEVAADNSTDDANGNDKLNLWDCIEFIEMNYKKENFFCWTIDIQIDISK